MKNRLRFFLALLVITNSMVNMAKAQDTVLKVPVNARLDSLKSGILNQERLIQVFVPPDYKPGSTDKYDVLYVLDGGNWNTGLITQVQRFLEGEGNMPPTIIVSVLGIDRNKDLTPTHLKDWKTSGGADKFLAFIKNELIPHVNKTYPSNGDNTLWGHSLGGLFVMYALLNEPKVFKSYIAVDPSLWWDNCYLPKIAAGKLPALAGLNNTLFISGRDGKDGRSMKIDTMGTILKSIAPAGLTWKVSIYPDETHSSVRFKTTYDGLKFTYTGFSGGIEFHPMNGIVLKDKPIKILYFNDTSKVYYTLDGTVPTTSSAKALPEIALTGAATVTYKRFTNRSNYDKTITGNFITGNALHPVAKPKSLKPGGFNYAYYEGDWDKWPDVKNLTPVKTGITGNDFDLDNLPRKNNYALVIDGMLETKEDGYYLFILDADKGSKLYVGNKLLIQWDGNYNQRTFTYILPLAKGFYPLRIEYLHKKEDFKLKLSYLPPGVMDTKNITPIPVALQYNR
ncbi:alpha/beta hydrolase-fold protein [Mucilaginibacter sp. FT3.2]|uniref:alpha/beta hydrolase-fold protein n=1 Tax=Mucilaginibacter sp. FT3.2 TaxID=2723090 RepID=UPI00160ABAC9|nr:alpha/beta hydrolase-fold protein [Mucilaginibacter sp. FT3.2]MBB6232316.1 putative alpha/beta superfamily hydrolase [Mucilaginibacter sp. FT3.2]